MKKIFLSLAVAVIGGLTAATARDATNVQVNLKHEAGKPVTVQKIALPGGVPAGMENNIMKPHATGGWQVVNVPIRVEAYTKKKDDNGNALPVHFIPSLDVKVYLLFETQDAKAKDGAALLLSKELNYVNIPVPTDGKKKGIRENEFYAAVFISPADAWKINEKAKGELAGKLVAYAVEANFNGANCMNADKKKYPQDVVQERKYEREWGLTGKWWGKTSNSRGAELKAINETPFAFSFLSFYPTQTPLLVTGAGASPLGVPAMPAPVATAPAEETAPTSDDATPTDTTTGGDTGADTTSTETDDSADDSSTKRGKGRTRSSRRRSSN